LAKTARSLITVDCDQWVHENIWPSLPANVRTATSADDLPLASVDLVFVDGLHTTGAVTADIAVALKLLRPSGLVVFHDVDMPVVEVAVRAAFGWVGRLLPNLGWVRK
jgi:hypothetical protein